MKRLMAIAVLGVSGCTAEDGAVLEIQSAIPPNEACEFSADSETYQASGVFDPAHAGPEGHYRLNLLLRNNIGTTVSDSATGVADREVRTSSNDIALLGFDACWYRSDTRGFSDLDSHADGSPVKCEDLPEDQRGFITTSGVVGQDGGETVSRVYVLPREALQAAGVYGSAFDPDLIPPGADPTEAGRDPAWGNYPLSHNSRVLVQVRAVGKLGTGRTVRSQWYTYPIDMAVGYVEERRLACCALSEYPCTLTDIPCGDGSIGKTGVLLDFGAACGLSAQYFNFECFEFNSCVD